MAIAGKKSKVLVSTDGTEFTDVQDLNEASISIEGDNQDITTFGSDHIKRLQGLKDNSFSLSGFENPDDSTGQRAILRALLDDTEIHAQFLPDGTTGFGQEVKVSSYEPDSSVDGTVELSIELEGTGAITLV